MMDGELKKAALRLVKATQSEAATQIEVMVSIQTQGGMRTYQIWIPVQEAAAGTCRRIRNMLGSALELGVSLLDGSLERKDTSD